MITVQQLGVLLMQKRMCPGNEAVAKAKMLLAAIEEIEKKAEMKELQGMVNEPDATELKINKLVEITLINQEVLNNILKVLVPGPIKIREDAIPKKEDVKREDV